MGKTLIDLDDELLAQARVVLGTGTKKDTVNAALREVVRRWAVVEFGLLARTGIFDELGTWGTARVPEVPGEEPCR
jgi:Arc/MetJ family transcription regulator